MANSAVPDMQQVRRQGWKRFILMLAAFGPGLMVMLADTDAGSVITAAQSGAQWGYKMILPQLILIPILYLVQEVTLRLGIVTGKGHGELIREGFGLKWAILSVLTLFVASVGALVTEFAGLAGVSELFGVPGWITVSAATLFLIALGLSGSYKRVERVGIAVGLLELLFIPAAFMAHPHLPDLISGVRSIPIHNANYMFLLAANVGAVIMPWMVFYQQGAVIDKKLGPQHLRTAKSDTLIGSVVTQIIMIAVVIATAATLGMSHPGQSLNDVQQIAQALVPFMGVAGAKVVFGLGMVGASFIAALVVSVAGAWGIGEAFGFNHSLNHRFKDAKVFYSIYTLAHVGGALLVIFSVNLIQLNIDVEVMNAMLLPIVLGFLLALEAKVLPTEWRMKGAYKYTVWTVSGLVMLFGLYMALTTL
ncbi:NRAMP family divalent metal transporter [Alicyclobacillus sp. SO9]|uniref:NRAMP family divalent metal transporter n=1 Tax=Alicyclobacillus sp. SO9 TaxID=2665646 RepID=UPI0018E8D522|nr:divalent metal cation transporter [Alicyclobacillus sp. SO9]QQE78150.1 divalent metal cation transporter [Alicyclobacillus sp. SO9]